MYRAFPFIVMLLTFVRCGDIEHPKMPVQSEAFAVVRQHFGMLFAGRAMTEPDVHWWTTNCPGTETTAVVLGQTCYAGIYYRQQGVDVAWRGTFSESAYTHELMHYFLHEFNSGSDPLHQQAIPWQVVREADASLQGRGL